MKGPRKSWEKSWRVGRRSHGPSAHTVVHAEAAGRGHSPGSPLRGPHFQLRSARDAEALWVERDGVHGPALYAGGVDLAGFLDGVLPQPGGCGSTCGV